MISRLFCIRFSSSLGTKLRTKLQRDGSFRFLVYVFVQELDPCEVPFCLFSPRKKSKRRLVSLHVNQTEFQNFEGTVPAPYCLLSLATKINKNGCKMFLQRVFKNCTLSEIEKPRKTQETFIVAPL